MNPVSGPVVVLGLIVILALFLLWRSEAQSAAAWRRKAREYRSELADPVYPPAVLDWIAEQRAGWPVERINNVRLMDVAPVTEVWPGYQGRVISIDTATEAAARRRHPAGRGLHSAGGEG